MDEKYILTIDVGTQSIRGIIFDKSGNMAAKEKREYTPYFSLAPGYAEKDANFYWSTICDVCQTLKENNQGVFEGIIGVTITTMRNTVVPVNQKGEPLRAAILWLDQRRAISDEKFPAFYKMALKIVKEEVKIRNFKKAFRWQWIKENEKEVYDSTYKYLLLSAFLNFKLTGFFIDSSASQIGYIPFDFKRVKWASKYDIKSFVFNIDINKMPQLVDSGGIAGSVSKEASHETGLPKGLPVIASGSERVRDSWNRLYK